VSPHPPDDSVHNPKVVGIDTYGFRSYAIVGVMSPGFRFPDKAEIWLSAGRMGVRVPDPGSPGLWSALLPGSAATVDYEYRVQTSETLLDIAATRLMLNRLAPA